MELSTAVGLIRDGVPSSSTPQTWADLGSGKGLFTHALSTLLPSGSIIYAIDQDAAAVNSIRTTLSHIAVKRVVTDFVNHNFHGETLDGILMANSLHFVKDKLKFMKDVRLSLTQSGRMVIVEYDTERSNAWVPYPISYSSLERAYINMGFASISMIGSTLSKYHQANIYSALLQLQ
jgi:ubiquinone/menaquinone biosynthesis C-methylase UbiE